MTDFIQDPPFNVPMVLEDRELPIEWQVWFSQAGKVLQSATESGTSANRPTAELWIGREYFDKTLGHKIWVKSARPDVWVDGVGSVV